MNFISEMMACKLEVQIMSFPRGNIQRILKLKTQMLHHSPMCFRQELNASTVLKFIRMYHLGSRTLKMYFWIIRGCLEWIFKGKANEQIL